MNPPHNLTMGECLQILQTLEDLLKPSFGPNGKRTLISTSCGNVLMTADGSTILNYLSMSHPIGRWITESVKQHHQLCGDNTKSYILILSSFIREIHKLYSDSQRSCKSERAFLIGVAHGIDNIKDDIFPQKILPKIKSLLSCERSCDFFVMKELLRSFIHGKVPQNLCEGLTKLLVDFLYQSSTEDANICDVLRYIIDNFPLVCQEVNGKPVSDSFFLDGVILSRDFAYPMNFLKEGYHCRYVMLNIDFMEVFTPLTNSTVNIYSSANLRGLAKVKTEKYKAFLARLDAMDVNFILSVELIPDELISFCEERNICVVHALSEEEINRLSYCCGIRVINDLAEEVITKQVGEATSVHQLILSGKSFARLTPLGANINMKHLVVCGPSASFTRLYSSVMKNGLKMLKFCLREENVINLHVEGISSESPIDKTIHASSMFYTVPGGGCSELLVSNLLLKENEIMASSNHIHQIILKAFGKALLSVPKALHANSYQVGNKQFVQLWMEWDNLFRNKNITGVDCKSGNLKSISESSVVESLGGKWQLWSSVLETAKQVLRIDMIVGVKTLDKRDVTSIDGK